MRPVLYIHLLRDLRFLWTPIQLDPIHCRTRVPWTNLTVSRRGTGRTGFPKGLRRYGYKGHRHYRWRFHHQPDEQDCRLAMATSSCVPPIPPPPPSPPPHPTPPPPHWPLYGTYAAAWFQSHTALLHWRAFRPGLEIFTSCYRFVWQQLNYYGDACFYSQYTSNLMTVRKYCAQSVSYINSTWMIPGRWGVHTHLFLHWNHSVCDILQSHISKWIVEMVKVAYHSTDQDSASRKSHCTWTEGFGIFMGIYMSYCIRRCYVGRFSAICRSLPKELSARSHSYWWWEMATLVQHVCGQQSFITPPYRHSREQTNP